MGFVNLARGLRAVGYLEPDPLPAGPVALVTHSGSVFSALLRTRRGLGFTLAVSSGQELVTAAPRLRRLRAEPARDPGAGAGPGGDPGRQPSCARCWPRAGGRTSRWCCSPRAARPAAGRWCAHSGALAAADGGWEALAGAYGVHRVRDLAEMADTLELFAVRPPLRRRAAPASPPCTTRAWNARTSPTWPTSWACRSRRSASRPRHGWPGCSTRAWSRPTRWTCGAPAQAQEQLSRAALAALADDPAVAAVALAVDLVPEFDGDESYPLAVTATAPAHQQAGGGAEQPCPPPSTRRPRPSCARRASRCWRAPAPACSPCATCWTTRGRPAASRPRTADDPDPAAPSALGPRCSRAAAPDSAAAVRPAARLRHRGRARQAAPSTSAPARARRGRGDRLPGRAQDRRARHRAQVGRRAACGSASASPAELAAAYDDLADRLGPPGAGRARRSRPARAVALGLARDPALGPLLVVGRRRAAGGDCWPTGPSRCPRSTRGRPARLLGRLRAGPACWPGARGQPAADLDAIAAAITGLSALACDLGDVLDALDINPLICGPHGAVAVDALAIPRLGPGHRYDLRHGSRTRAVSGTGSLVRHGHQHRHQPGGLAAVVRRRRAAVRAPRASPRPTRLPLPARPAWRGSSASPSRSTPDTRR